MASVAILFSGDFYPMNRIHKLVSIGRSSECFGNLLGDLKLKDLSVTNLEGPITARNTPTAKAGPNQKIHPQCIELLKAGGFDIVNLANNHIMDHGPEGLTETCEVLQTNDISYVGAGSTISCAQTPLQMEYRGKVFEFLAFAENEFNLAYEDKAGVWPLNPITNISQIKEAKARSDFVIVMVHGGNELCPIPNPRIVETYRAFVDAGASAVIGTHPHVPQGYEIYKSSSIFYSLGNLTFDSFPKRKEWPQWFKSYLARVHFQGKNKKPEIIPYKASEKTGQLTLLNGNEQNQFAAHIDFLSEIIKDSKDLRKYWNAWCAWRGPKLFRLFTLSSLPALIYSGSSRKMSIAAKFFLFTENLVACESHRDIIRTYVELVRTGEIKKANEDIFLVKQLRNGLVPEQAV